MEISGLSNNTTDNLKQKKIIKTDKTTRLDDLSAKYLKLSAQVISKPLTAILNLSIQSSSCSNALIKAKVTPIFKKGSKADVNNYRPISVLPIINSIFERHISNCLVNYLESNSPLYNQLSGSRKSSLMSNSTDQNIGQFASCH